MREAQIKYGAIYSKIDREFYPLLKKPLSYKQEIWIQGPFSKKRRIVEISCIKPDGTVLTGFLPRVTEILLKHNIKPIMDDSFKKITVRAERTELPFQLTEEQKEAVEEIFLNGRGVIHLPTGTGKSIIFLSVIKMVNKPTTILVHTKDLFYQIINMAKDFAIDMGMVGDGHNIQKPITVALLKSGLTKLETSPFLVIIDEAHHCSNLKGMYADLLKSLTSPMKIGFTATLPYKEGAKMALEGLIGPVIYSKSIIEMADSELLAKPIIQLEMLPINTEIQDLKTWQEVYQFGIVNNKSRNRKILSNANKYIESGKTVLILVTAVKHGHNLMCMANTMYPNMRPRFVYGDVSGPVRSQIKEALDKKQIRCVIADVVWKEGVNIPSLGAIINAGGGKSEIMVLQSIGRGLRRTPEKTEVILKDYFDSSHKHLINHFGHRLCLYFSQGWLGQKEN